MDWPFLNQRELVTIHPWSPEALGPQATAWNLPGSGNSSLVFTSTLAYYVPFVLSVPIVAAEMFLYNGATVTGNFDLGIYGPSGTRLVSTGSVAQSGANALQAVDIPDTKIGPGQFYLAFAASGTVAVFSQGLGLSTIAFLGVLQQIPAFPLPATATFAKIASTTRFAPMFGLTGKALL